MMCPAASAFHAGHGTDFRHSDGSVSRKLRQPVGNLVVIALIGDEDMLRRFQIRRRIQRAGPYADVTAVSGLPKELRAASIAKPPPGDRGRLVPAQSWRRQHAQVLGGARGRGLKMPAGAAAHGAVAVDHRPQGTVDLETHRSAQASPACDGAPGLLGDWGFRHIGRSRETERAQPLSFLLSVRYRLFGASRSM